MERKTRPIRRAQRLEAALALLGSAETLADIGCDHGQFGAEALVRGLCERVVASDISAPSLEKARALANKLGLESRFRFVLSSGLSHLAPGEADRAAMLGMGGELISELIEADLAAARSLDLIVMQPMRGEAELRRYLYENGFRIFGEAVVRERGRFYQLISAGYSPSEASVLPEGWPEGYYQFGPAAVLRRDELAYLMIKRYLGIITRKLERAEANASEPEALVFERDACLKILETYYPDMNGEN